jgi:hypothetical protein
MIELAADPYLRDHTVHAVILQQHQDAYNVSKVFGEIFGDKISLVILPEPTSGPAETIYQAVQRLQLPDDAPFLVHDCDSRFSHSDLASGNALFVDSLNNHPSLRTPANKSYVEINDQGIVVSIIEKKIISDLFCVGGYQFAAAGSYKRSYEDLIGSRIGEIYISTVIDNLISAGEIFTINPVSGFVDLGTREDWERFNDRPTIFCDIDGTLVHNQAPYGDNSYASAPIMLEKNAAVLKRALDHGCQIIFTTSRSSKWRAETSKMLEAAGFAESQLIMDLHHARRILINDYAPTNPYPSAVAINLKRDDDELDQMLRF